MKSRSIAVSLFVVTLIALIALIAQSLPIAAVAHPYQVNTYESYREEEQKLREAIKQDPTNPQRYLDLAQAFEYESGEGEWTNCHEHSITVYREAIVRARRNAEVHFSLGKALMADPTNSGYCIEDEEFSDPVRTRARKHAGLRELRRAIAIDPKNTTYQKALREALESLQPRTTPSSP